MKLSDIPKVEIPNKLNICPILEAVIEIRFNASIDEDAVFGSIFDKLKKEWGNVQRLPALEIPSYIRKQDPNLSFAPLYRLEKNNHLLQIGTNVLSLVSQGEYLGSEIFFKEFDNVLDKVNSDNFFRKFLRVGIRYVDFFEQNIFENLRLDFSIADKPIDYTHTQIRTSIQGEDNFLLTTNIAGDVFASGKKRKGFVFDVDTHRDTLEGVETTEIKQLIRSAHKQQKQLFFGLINSEFLNSFEPTYDIKE